MNIKTKHLFYFFILLFVLQNMSYAQKDTSNYVLGKYRILKSKILNEDRKLLIHLPDNYNSSQDKYPVLYILDGDWNFLISTAYVNVLSIEKRIPQMIIVAILNVDRLHDFLPTHVEQVPTSGGSDDFIKFFNAELIPFVDKNYRTKSYRILYGASNSGLYVIYHLLKSPDSFIGFISGSPTTRHDDFFVNKLADTIFTNKQFSQKYLFITYGKDEGDWLISPIKDFKNILNTKSPKNIIWKVQEFNNEGHVPPMSIYEGLKYIFIENKVN